ncbi:hypothetical protein BJF85_00085 [Saccharomonospora sp. CUA-673]|uniref:hypothetical protein n=1 Tax=Saccharomonospora sp. CUA-673 TaxID=1904969 RepID=UPI0009622DA6|nr:hypothetical protein [Saccharomonospora sp. CUA-673]OLT46919.1 hypothetical protein BJF85_00085 [Saccharomonospora sp. CUA-673]
MTASGNAEQSNLSAAADPGVLAARAEDATRALQQWAARRTAGSGAVDRAEQEAELHEVLASLRQLSENLARFLPEAGSWLEQQLWSGNLGDDADYSELTQSTFEAAAALSRAQRMASQLGRELHAAELASRSLIRQ